MNSEKTVEVTPSSGNIANAVLAAVNVKVLHLNIKGVETHYRERIWIDDPNEDEGGMFQYVQKKHDSPKIILDFKGQTDIELIVNGAYSDGTNIFIATSKNEIRNYSTCVNSFSIPKELICISTPYCG